MRGIRKGPPPASVSPPDQAVLRLQDAQQALRHALDTVGGNAVEYARARFDELHKPALRQALAREQRHLCVYCERRVREKEKDDRLAPPIAHWHPLKHRPDLALEWKNLYLSCRDKHTCDHRQKECLLAWSASDTPLKWPAEAHYEDCVSYTRGGEMYVRADAPLDGSTRKALALAIADQLDGDQTRTSLLNLNHDTLVSARKAAMDVERERLEKEFPRRRASMVERKAIADTLLGEEKYLEYVSVRVAWLTGAIGKCRPPDL